jgi:hypothetical protein
MRPWLSLPRVSAYTCRSPRTDNDIRFLVPRWRLHSNSSCQVWSREVGQRRCRQRRRPPSDCLLFLHVFVTTSSAATAFGRGDCDSPPTSDHRQLRKTSLHLLSWSRAMLVRAAAISGDPFRDPASGEREVGVPGQLRVAGVLGDEGARPTAGQGGKFFDECAELGPARREFAVVQAVVLLEPGQPAAEVLDALLAFQLVELEPLDGLLGKGALVFIVGGPSVRRPL